MDSIVPRRTEQLSQWRNQIRQEVVQDVLCEYVEKPLVVEDVHDDIKVDEQQYLAKWRRYVGICYWRNMHEAVIDGDRAGIAYQMKRRKNKDRKLQRLTGTERNNTESIASRHIDAWDQEGRTPLSLAVKEERGDVVEELILYQANVNKAEDVENYPKILTGASALMHAIQSDQIHVAARLVEHGADVNHRNQYGMTPLMLAAIKNDLELVDILIENFADLDAKDIYGCTALHYCAIAGSLGATNRILDAGASKKKKDKKGFTARDWALFLRRHRMEAQKKPENKSKFVSDDNSSAPSRISNNSSYVSASTIGPSAVAPEDISSLKEAPPSKVQVNIHGTPEIYGQIEALIENRKMS